MLKILISILSIGITYFIQSKVDIKLGVNTYVEINQYNDNILWDSSNVLTWELFTGSVPDNLKGKEAETQCSIEIKKIGLEGKLPKIIIGTYFIPNKSWSITNKPATLKHEQLHFDIYELYARKIRKKFQSLNKDEITEIDTYQDNFDNLINEAIKRNNQYDNEVYFNDIKQKKWQERIAKELEELKEYEYIPEE